MLSLGKYFFNFFESSKCQNLKCKDCSKLNCICQKILLQNNLKPHKCKFTECQNFPFYFHKNGNTCFFHH